MSRADIFKELNPNTIIVAVFSNLDSAKEAFENICSNFNYPKSRIIRIESKIEISNITSDLYLQNMLSVIEKMGAEISIKK